MTSFYNME